MADLRNLALDRARGDFVISWDDDDWYGRERIEAQVAAQRGGAAVVLRHQIRYSLPSARACYKERPTGIPGTILHPLRGTERYPRLKRGSDTQFLDAFPQVIVLDNEPGLYIRFYHGLNLWDEAHIMGKHTAARPGSALRRNDQRLMDAVLAEHEEAYRAFRTPAKSAATERRS